MFSSARRPLDGYGQPLKGVGSPEFYGEGLMKSMDNVYSSRAAGRYTPFSS